MQYLFRVKSKGGYQQATLHPWPCLAFSLPFLAIYEIGLLCIGRQQQDSIRTGADTWLHWVLSGVGLTHYFWTAAFVLLFLGVWAWRARKGRPGDLVGICSGMTVESIIFALLLCGLSRGLNALIAQASVLMAESASTESTLEHIVTYMGAGIYEELIFRLLLFSATLWLLYHMRLSGKAALIIAAGTSSLMFAAAHHFGPHGEDFDVRAFLFRMLAGLYFTFVFYFRGFGIAAGSHAVYDVVVGILAM